MSADAIDRSANANARPIRIGVVSSEAIRLAGLVSVFDQPAQPDKPQLVPVPGATEELLAGDTPGYIVIDLHASTGMAAIESVRRARPDIRLIVIGPHDDEDLVMNAIVAGARAYLDPEAGPDVVRQAIEVVTSGSIWAPRRLLSRLIDRLLKVPESSLSRLPELTERERQVLELVVRAQTNREIAAQLGLEERTVKSYIGRLMRKTGSDNRVKLTMSPISLALFPEIAGKRRHSTAVDVTD